jgi:hypothetical protein
MGRLLALLIAAALPLAACSKASAPSAATAPAAPSTDFDRKWAALAATEVEAFYVEDARAAAARSWRW